LLIFIQLIPSLSRKAETMQHQYRDKIVVPLNNELDTKKLASYFSEKEFEIVLNEDQ